MTLNQCPIALLYSLPIKENSRKQCVSSNGRKSSLSAQKASLSAHGGHLIKKNNRITYSFAVKTLLEFPVLEIMRKMC
jgi:hypothetical protein